MSSNLTPTAGQVKFEGETAWLSQAQMVELFETTKQNISLHIRNIFEEGELSRSSVVKQYLTTAPDGKRYSVEYYNLSDFDRAAGKLLKKAKK